MRLLDTLERILGGICSTVIWLCRITYLPIDILNEPRGWIALTARAKSKVVRTSYFWVIFISFAAVILEPLPSQLTLPILGQQFTLRLALPFNWIVFYFSAVCAAIATSIVRSSCPDIIFDFENTEEFLSSGRGSTALKAWISLYRVVHIKKTQRVLSFSLHFLSRFCVDRITGTRQLENAEALYKRFYELTRGCVQGPEINHLFELDRPLWSRDLELLDQEVARLLSESDVLEQFYAEAFTFLRIAWDTALKDIRIWPHRLFVIAELLAAWVLLQQAWTVVRIAMR